MNTARTRYASAISAKAGIVNVVMASATAPRTSAVPTARAVLFIGVGADVDYFVECIGDCEHQLHDRFTARSALIALSTCAGPNAYGNSSSHSDSHPLRKGIQCHT